MAACSASQTRKGTPDRISSWILPAEWQVSLLPHKSDRCVTWAKESLAKTVRVWEWSVKGCVNLLNICIGQFTKLFVFGIRQAELLQTQSKQEVLGSNVQAVFLFSSIKFTSQATGHLYWSYMHLHIFEFVDCMAFLKTTVGKLCHTAGVRFWWPWAELFKQIPGIIPPTLSDWVGNPPFSE